MISGAKIRTPVFALRCVAVLYFCFVAAGLYAAAPVVINDGFESVGLGRHLELFEDTAKRYSIDDISSPFFSEKFTPSVSENPNFGYTRSAIWARFFVRNDTARDIEWLLELPQPFVDHVDFFVLSEDGRMAFKTGDMHPFGTRPVKHRNFIFPVRQKPGLAACYLRVETTSTLGLMLYLWTSRAFGAHEDIENSVLWTFYGVMLAMLIYNLFIFISVRDRSYLYYVFFVAMLLLYTMTFNGISFKSLWPESVWWANVSLSVFVHLLGFGFYLFARSFINTRETMPVLDRLLLALAGVCIVNVVIVLASPPGSADGLGVYTSIAGMAVITAVVVVSLKRRVRSAGIYLLAWLVYLIGVSVAILRALTILPSNFITHYSIHIGAALQVLLFASGLADRINGMRADRVRALEALAESEEKYRRLIENATEAIFITRDYKIVFANARTFEFVGRRPEELIDVPYLDYIHPDDRDEMRDRFTRRVTGEDLPNEHEFRLLDSDGGVRWMRVSAMRILWQGRPAVLNFMNDISGRKKSEALIADSLKEKELLLKEIHHRVKNNMQILSSLLNLQMRTIKDESVRDIFMESQNRIRSMSLIHEKIYKSDDFMGVDFSDYIGKLARSLINSYSSVQGVVRLDIRVENVFLGIDDAIPCGLIVNELLTNCFKHAFPGGRRGEVIVGFRSEAAGSPDGARYILSVRDTGVGIGGRVNVESPDTLGLQLVRTLVGQLHGELEIVSEAGTEFIISFRSRALYRQGP